MSRKLPTFIVIGSGRSGTTWIYEALREHPEVATARGTKETLFFDWEFYRGLDWYSSFFEGCDSYLAVGEVSNAYIYNPLVPARIKSVLPDVALIACLRNPLERIASVYLYRRRVGTVSCAFDRAVGRYSDLVLNNFYWTQLQWFLSIFDKNQLKILFYDDLKRDPAMFARSLYDAVQVSTDFEPSILHKKVNPATDARNPFVGRLSSMVATGLRATGLHSLLDDIKRNSFLRSLLLKEIPSSDTTPVIIPELQRELVDIFRPEIEGVARFSGRDLSHWLVSQAQMSTPTQE